MTTTSLSLSLFLSLYTKGVGKHGKYLPHRHGFDYYLVRIFFTSTIHTHAVVYIHLLINQQGVPYAHDDCPCHICFYPDQHCEESCNPRTFTMLTTLSHMHTPHNMPQPHMYIYTSALKTINATYSYLIFLTYCRTVVAMMAPCRVCAVPTG